MDKKTDEVKRVFISYSWAVKERVIELARRLRFNSIDVILDVFELKEGQDKYTYMEQAVNDDSIDKVLIICDKSYAEKANNRSGGVGDETLIISPEVYGKTKQEKFIPVVFEVDEEGNAYLPSYIKSRIYIDLSSEEDQYEIEYEKLLRNIFDKPLYKKPPLGMKPEWLDDDTIDLSVIRDLIKQMRSYSGGNTNKIEFLLRRLSDEFILTAKQYRLPDDKARDEGLLIIIDKLKNYRDLFINYCEALIYSGLPISSAITSLFERLYNDLLDATDRSSYDASEFEHFNFLIWELFICVTATLLHYNKYMDLHAILTHTYFLRKSYFDNMVDAFSYCKFYTYVRTIEEVCKPKCIEPKLITLTGKILIEREKPPILIKESISNADIILYQLSFVLDIPENDDYNSWFPITYIYHNNVQIIWQKLKSKEFCFEIAPLFGVKTVSDLKDLLSIKKIEKNVRYQNSFNSAPNILQRIKIDDIGSLK